MRISTGDAFVIASKLHEDLRALTVAVERLAELLALSLDGERSFSVRQTGAVVGRDDGP